MAFNPGPITPNIAPQLMLQGAQAQGQMYAGLGKSIGQGIEQWAQRKEESKTAESTAKALETIIRNDPGTFGFDSGSPEGEDAMESFLTRGADESAIAWNSRLKNFLGAKITATQIKEAQQQAAIRQQQMAAAKAAQDQAAKDAAFVGDFLRAAQQQPQQGAPAPAAQGATQGAAQPPMDVRQMLGRAIQAGNIPSPQALDRIDTIAKFFQPQQQAEIIPINQLENKYPSERFSVDSVPIGNGMLQIKSVNTRAPQSEKQKFQSISPMADESGKFVGWSVFDETKGKHFLRPVGEESAELPITPNLRPITPTALNREIMGMTDFKKVSDAVVDDERSLNALSRYWKSVEDSNVGWRTLADKFTAGMKTVIGEGKKALTTEELNRAISEGRLQGLIGGLRTTVVGPGVMTEQDALRIIARLGGDVNALRNPEVVRQALMDLYQDTHSRYTNNLNFYNAAVKSYYGSQGNFSEKKPVGMDPKIFGGDIIYGGALVAPSK